ncbi:hypothetical protein N7532_001034 [Penicillium argentinense]|uniref:Uncharacterized protein n=1 Tax=Penicillium argentinense TaxID=1131581 RepID=A0A9W9G1P5_9EURO|nr:uncharacterized protein N7532_001034 [Penicillium argentinense]KAJ5110499.1 hypothetical protein N7532_001034 [Penicillium argentinense]
MSAATMVVKSRTAPANEAISFPVLTYSDAKPRNDLQDLDDGAKQRQNQSSLAQFNFPQPVGAEERSNRKPLPVDTATFDFRVTAPPDEVVPSRAMMDRSPIGIGIALGSPGMLESKENLPPPRFNTNIFVDEQKQQSQPRKTSKWKKIGGLFRAKSALASPTQPRPNIPKQSAKEKPSSSGKQTPEKHGTEEWPRIETDAKPTTTSSSTPQRTRKFSLSNRKGLKEKNGENMQGPRLDVDIPDVQMERYSVMFSTVMNRNQRPSLLARRSKTLDNLHVPSNSVSHAATIGTMTIFEPTSNHEMQEFLTAKVPPVPKRRATSPARSSFTLFPTSQPSKAAQVLGTQNFSRGPSPLLRSNTLPVESPSRTSPFELPPGIPNNNSVSSFESPSFPKPFSEHSNTPRSSGTSSRFEDKPLPAIKPEPEPTSYTQKASSLPKPSKIRQQSIKPMSKTYPQPRPRSSSLMKEHSLQREFVRSNKPNLTINTGSPPRPPAKDSSIQSSSTPDSGRPIQKLVTDPPAITMSPVPLSSVSGTMSTISPQLPQKPSPSTQIPVSDAKKTEATAKQIPTIEVSTARSISVSKGRGRCLFRSELAWTTSTRMSGSWRGRR